MIDALMIGEFFVDVLGTGFVSLAEVVVIIVVLIVMMMVMIMIYNDADQDELHDDIDTIIIYSIYSGFFKPLSTRLQPVH